MRTEEREAGTVENRRVLVGVSGGVDSAAALLLLLRGGWEPVALYLRLTEEGDPAPARRTAESLGAAFHTADCRDLFRREVEAPFAAAWAAGETPNPCVRCNRRAKFAALLAWADRLDCPYVATGHYARVDRDPAGGRCRLRRGLDPARDQSYFLYGLGQEVLSRLLLPLGELDKAAVRALAREAGLEAAGRRDSQDICFIPDGDCAAYLARQGVPFRPGDFVDREGRVLGRHRGLAAYTVGQRRGLGVSGGRPLYVLEKRAADNAVVLGEAAELLTERVRTRDFLWAAGAPPEGPVAAEVRLRHSRAAVPAVLTPLAGGGVEAVFSAPQRSPAPGQSLVAYRGDVVLGGGVLTEGPPEG